MLLTILVLTNYIINSARYEEFLHLINMLEMRDRLRNDDDSPLMQQRIKES